ncbi:hypothetical protein [Arcanobacterium pinnipediorum]|nr:hypothetical protein [Arcanobacterium pinnipediorum]
MTTHDEDNPVQEVSIIDGKENRQAIEVYAIAGTSSELATFTSST